MAAMITPTTTNLAGLAGSSMIPEKVINLQVAPIEQVLSVYAELTGRTVLRPTTLPATSVTLKNQQELSREEAIQALESVLALNGITMIDVGDKFVSAVPTQQALTEGAAFSKEEAKNLAELGQFVTKIVQVTNALPSEVAQVIQTFGKIQGGVVPIDSTMTLVLRDYPPNIKRMMEIIEKVDVKVESDYRLEVIPIKYGKVEEIYSTMSSVIGGGGASVGMGAGGTGTLSTRRGTTGARGGSQFRSNFRQTNITGSQRQTGQYQTQAQVGQAGQLGQAGAASTFNQRLQGLVSRMSAMGEGQLVVDAKIIPDERSNSLIVYATKDDMKMITNIVEKVDRLLAQVLIEAIIMDVQLNDNFEFGVSTFMRQQQTGNLTSIAAAKNSPSFLAAITNIMDGSGLPGGFSYFGKYSSDLDVAVKALASNGKGEILATPRVQTSHATPANFTVGESVPYVTSTYYGGYGGYGYGPSAQLQQLDVQTYLDVTPYITPDGLVVMEINQNIEEITGYTEIANVGKMPNTTHRSASATVSVQDGDTIILGGYIRASKSKSKSGVPILKDIPGIGGLFRSTSKEAKRSELLVLIRPTVLPSPRDAAQAVDHARENMPGIRDMEDEWKADYEKLNQRSNDRRKK
ncbi:MAG: Type II secretion system protein D precursor [Verrucomicrobia bacterium ADurb.Bin006]|jgi:general secretion pathway protein D|nr:MAG: Type II secretion system protein D precursor [Verrucomicrobia bacterium ADurb.Bin006]